MAWHIPALGALLVIATAALAAPAAAAGGNAGSRSPVVRTAPGAAASVTVRARIIRASARIGHGFGPPARGMTPRRAMLSAADGRPVAALVYDFE